MQRKIWERRAEAAGCWLLARLAIVRPNQQSFAATP